MLDVSRASEAMWSRPALSVLMEERSEEPMVGSVAASVVNRKIWA